MDCDLFGPPHNGTDTSREAAEAIRPVAATMRDRIALAVYAAGADGATDQELAERLGMDPSTVRPRRGELVAAGRLADLGERRQTKAGRRAIVWHSTVWAAHAGRP